MRLIDADALKTEARKLENIGDNDFERGFCWGVDEVVNLIESAPTVDAEPVRHGRWIEKPPYEDETVKGLEFQIVCSRCDAQNSSITFDENSVPIGKSFWMSRYCPNCGARMDGDSE